MLLLQLLDEQSYQQQRLSRTVLLHLSGERCIQQLSILLLQLQDIIAVNTIVPSFAKVATAK